jgi:GntR family transcriptional regulator
MVTPFCERSLSVAAKKKPMTLFRANEPIHLEVASAVPLWQQLETVIYDRIRSRCPVGTLLPGEIELVERFGVSRATVRKAYDSLINKGVIERQRALGTRVIGTPLTEDLGRMKSFSEEMRLKGRSVLTEMVGVTTHTPSPVLAAQMGLAKGERTLQIRRLRGHDQCFPIVLLTSELPESLGVSADEDFSKSLYELLEKKYSIVISHGMESIRAGKATAEEARLLGVETGETVLIIERLTYRRGNTQPIEFVRGVYRYDQYTFSMTMRR